MGCTSEIWMQFTRERYAKWALHVAENMLKLIRPSAGFQRRIAGACQSVTVTPSTP